MVTLLCWSIQPFHYHPPNIKKSKAPVIFSFIFHGDAGKWAGPKLDFLCFVVITRLVVVFKCLNEG